MRYYFSGDVTLFQGCQKLIIRPGCGAVCEADSDADAVAFWWGAYYGRRPEDRSEQPQTVTITREDGTSFPLAPHLYQIY